jgi:hypothetical protein
VPTVVNAVERSVARRGSQHTGWVITSWLTRLRPDPLKRLHLDLGSAGKELTGRARTSLPSATAVQRARVDSEVRALADDAATGLGTAWQESIRDASVSRIHDLNDRLDAALGDTDLGVARLPVWAGLVRVLQWVLILAAVVGAVWTVAAYVSGTLDDSSTPHVGGISLPLLLLLGGVGLGIVLALVCRLLVAGTARSRAARANQRLRSGVSEVAHELVVTPVQHELAAYSALRAGLDRATA